MTGRRQLQHYKHHARNETYCGISPPPPPPFGLVEICDPCWRGFAAHRRKKQAAGWMLFGSSPPLMCVPPEGDVPLPLLMGCAQRCGAGRRLEFPPCSRRRLRR